MTVIDLLRLAGEAFPDVKIELREYSRIEDDYVITSYRLYCGDRVFGSDTQYACKMIDAAKARFCVETRSRDSVLIALARCVEGDGNA